MNKIILVGRLTKDPELRTTTTGTSVLNFTVAVNRRFKNKDGQYEADFLPCVAYNTTADFIHKFFKKGNMICLEGRVQVRNYDAQDGTKRYVTEVIVENVEFVGGKNENSNTGSSMNVDNGYYPDAPANDNIIDTVNEVDVSGTDPYENYDSSVVLSDNDLPF